jgi:hypothetical protein
MKKEARDRHGNVSFKSRLSIFPKSRSQELYMTTIEKSITVKKPGTDWRSAATLANQHRRQKGAIRHRDNRTDSGQKDRVAQHLGPPPQRRRDLSQPDSERDTGHVADGVSARRRYGTCRRHARRGFKKGRGRPAAVQGVYRVAGVRDRSLARRNQTRLTNSPTRICAVARSGPARTCQ